MGICSKIGRDFLLNSFFLLAVIAGLLNTNLFRQDVTTYHNGHGVIYPTELVLDSVPKVFSAVFFYDDIQNYNAIQKPAITYCYDACRYLSISRTPATKSKTELNFRSGTSFCYSSLFNIPHQNSDADEAPIFLETTT